MIKVGIIGASGYSGGELIRLLLRHPLAEITYLSADRYAGYKVDELFPNLKSNINQVFNKLSIKDILDKSDVIFICLPHGQSQHIIPQLMTGDHIIIDLGADYRLKDKELYQAWYSFDHQSPELLKEAVYGLPELYKNKIKESKLVANPGCYPTSIILALAPLVKNKIVGESTIVIDSKSGTSGAGRNLEPANLYAQRTESLTCYKPGKHQHTPEIEQVLTEISGINIKTSFVPHLVPMSRGLFSSINTSLKENLSEDEIRNIFIDFYSKEPFVELLTAGIYPETKYVNGTNFCYLQIAVDERSKRIIIFSVIDNLIKGAAGQAIQNMNLILDLEEEKGLRYEAFHV